MTESGDDALFRVGVEAVARAGQQEASVDGELDPAATAVMLRGVGAQYLIAPDDFDPAAAIDTGQRIVRQSLMPHTRK